MGYSNGSFVDTYLRDVLGFYERHDQQLQLSPPIRGGIKQWEIAAIFLDVPVAKVFLAEYYNSFIRTGETFKVGGFGFVSSPHSIIQYLDTF